MSLSWLCYILTYSNSGELSNDFGQRYFRFLIDIHAAGTAPAAEDKSAI
jgi:hypothetical protein